MNFSSIPLFNIMKTKLDYISARQSVLAQNIANADTPRYRAKDVTSPDFKQMAKDAGASKTPQLHMQITNAKHMTHSMSAPSAYKTQERATTDELNPNHNNVVIEEEISKVAANQAEYQKVLNLYGKAVTMFKTAIGHPSSGG